MCDTLEGVQPMFIRSKHNNGYLMATLPYDSERTKVVVEPIPARKDLSIDIGAFGVGVSKTIVDYDYEEDAKWLLIPNAYGQHEIIHNKLNEPLYAGDNHNAYDKDRRRVFTWHTKDHDNGPWRNWIVKRSTNGYYTIKNSTYGEYLYAADYPSTGHVFTWREPGQNWFNDKFYWLLINT